MWKGGKEGKLKVMTAYCPICKQYYSAMIRTKDRYARPDTIVLPCVNCAASRNKGA